MPEFSCKFCEISKKTFSYRTPPVVASEHDRKEKYDRQENLYFSFVCSPVMLNAVTISFSRTYRVDPQVKVIHYVIGR